MAQIFISHSRRDANVRNFFDSIFADTNIRAVRVEFEQFVDTSSNFIKDEYSTYRMRSLFFLDRMFVLRSTLKIGSVLKWVSRRL